MTQEQLLELIEMRRAEVAEYQKNIVMYQAMATALPSEYPAHLEQYKNAPDHHAAIAEIEDLDDVALLSDLWAHDQAKAGIRSETVEMRKSMAILAALEAQL